MAIAGGHAKAASTARSLAAAGAAALVGVVVVSAAPLSAPGPDLRPSTQTYTLTASSALLNVPQNMLNLVLSMPAWEVQAMNRLADAMIGTGSWQVWGPTNVFGFDEWDPPKLAGMIDMMMPVQPFSSVLGDQINWWAKANFPMVAGCAAVSGACPDSGALIGASLKVPASQLNNGYQFPSVINPLTRQPTSWSGQYVKVEPGAAFSSLWHYLSSEPQGVQTVPIGDYFSVPFRLTRSVFDAFYPFVQNSEWFSPKTPLSWAFRPLAPVICPTCGPEPYINGLPTPAATVAPVAPVAAVDRIEPAASVHIGEPAPVADPLPTPAPMPDEDAAGSPPPGLPEVPVSRPPARDTRPGPDAADRGPLRHRGAAADDHSAADKSGANRTRNSRN